MKYSHNIRQRISTGLQTQGDYIGRQTRETQLEPLKQWLRNKMGGDRQSTWEHMAPNKQQAMCSTDRDIWWPAWAHQQDRDTLYYFFGWIIPLNTFLFILLTVWCWIFLHFSTFLSTRKYKSGVLQQLYSELVLEIYILNRSGNIWQWQKWQGSDFENWALVWKLPPHYRNAGGLSKSSEATPPLRHVSQRLSLT